MKKLDCKNLCELLRGVDSVTFSLSQIGEETHSSREVYEAILEGHATGVAKIIEQLEHDLEDLSGLEIMQGDFAKGYMLATMNHIEIVKGGAEK